MQNRSIKPGQVWLDTNGNRTRAHGGSIIYVDGTFYWYGENKEKSRADSGIWHWGVRCYASKDLYNDVDCAGCRFASGVVSSGLDCGHWV